MEYQILTDATADICQEMFKGLPAVEVIPMEVLIDNTTYIYGPNGNLSTNDFYAMQREGKFATTSQISPETYKSAFEPYLQKGQDILYLGFSSGMSGTINSANICAEELKTAYPNRKIYCVDTLCASVGEGFIVREAAKRQSEGMMLDEVARWVGENRLRVCHWFTVDAFQHLLHGGRVSAASATIGTVLNIKPLLHVDHDGMLKIMGKPRGTKMAIKEKINKMEHGWLPELGELVIIGQADCQTVANNVREQVITQFPNAEIYVVDIGPIIGAHTGPGMIALIYWGTNR